MRYTETAAVHLEGCVASRGSVASLLALHFHDYRILSHIKTEYTLSNYTVALDRVY